MLRLTLLILAPGSLLLLTAIAPLLTASLEAQWPYYLPPHIKHFPGDESVIRRNLDIQGKFASHKPVGLQKMSSDEGEMFFPEYWRFDTKDDDPSKMPAIDKRGPALSLTHGANEDTWEDLPKNDTLLHSLQAPFMIHSNQWIDSQPAVRRLRQLRRALLFQLDSRDFKCPVDTFSCSSIDRANSCCPTGESCQLIAQSSLGDVGCCAAGQTCSQELSGCQDGYISCPGSFGGGCCIPGYQCVGIGCTVTYLT